MQKTPYVFPIVGGRKIEQLEANIEALDVVLSPEQIKYLESVFPFEMGVPYWHCVSLFASDDFTFILTRRCYRAMGPNTP